VLGARPLRRTIQRELEDQLSEKILFGELQPGHIIITDVEGWDGEGTADDKARFTFRGEPKPVQVPDTPPVVATE
jgi:ATP-dependent Clp protease ATP-binding subunit ClpC